MHFAALVEMSASQLRGDSAFVPDEGEMLNDDDRRC